jgi:hypothetical protein
MSRAYVPRCENWNHLKKEEAFVSSKCCALEKDEEVVGTVKVKLDMAFPEPELEAWDTWG